MNIQEEITFEQYQEIDKYLEDYKNNPSNSNKYRFGLHAYTANLIAIKETERAIKELTNTMPHTDGMRHYYTVVRRLSDLEQQLLKLKESRYEL